MQANSGAPLQGGGCRDPQLTAVIPSGRLEELIAALQRDGYTMVGPRRRDGAVLLEPFEDAAELAWGWVDAQDAAHYRIRQVGESTLEGFTVGPDAWKRFLYPPRLELLRARQSNGALEVIPSNQPAPRYAFLGVRPCDLAAVQILDRALNAPPFVDPEYVARREAALIVAMNCVRAGRTCFCTSQNTGPRAASGYDLALTELAHTAEGARYLAEAGSDRGKKLLERLSTTPATPDDLSLALRRTSEAAGKMGRFLENRGLPELLYASLESPIWGEIAGRCLNCKNCTLVCPTCFCVSVVDQTSLDGQEATRLRLWDTCHSRAFTYVHGGPTRPSPAARYRQWMTHKLAGWVEQFGSSGCVGCGRCITWCKASIDITAEAARLRSAAHAGGAGR